MHGAVRNRESAGLPVCRVLIISVELFARHAVERWTVVWTAADLSAVPSGPRNRCLGKVELGLLGGQTAIQRQIVFWRDPAKRGVDHDVAIIVAYFVRVQGFAGAQRAVGPDVVVIAVDDVAPDVWVAVFPCARRALRNAYRTMNLSGRPDAQVK